MDASIERPTRTALWPWIACTLCVLFGALAIRLEGRPWWCKCGELVLWISDPSGPHTSQHLADPYTITHFEHGLLFSSSSPGSTAGAADSAGSWPCSSKSRGRSSKTRTSSSSAIARPRRATISGDSVINSLGDVIACILGYALAEQIGRGRSLILVAVLEIALLFWIRDHLLLNIIMLAVPLEANQATANALIPKASRVVPTPAQKPSMTLAKKSQRFLLKLGQTYARLAGMCKRMSTSQLHLPRRCARRESVDSPAIGVPPACGLAGFPRQSPIASSLAYFVSRNTPKVSRGVFLRRVRVSCRIHDRTVQIGDFCTKKSSPRTPSQKYHASPRCAGQPRRPDLLSRLCLVAPGER